MVGFFVVVVCDPFLEYYKRSLREAVDVWLLGDCCRWIMKCMGGVGGGAEASRSAGSVLSCVMMGNVI